MRFLQMEKERGMLKKLPAVFFSIVAVASGLIRNEWNIKSAV